LGSKGDPRGYPALHYSVLVVYLGIYVRGDATAPFVLEVFPAQGRYRDKNVGIFSRHNESPFTKRKYAGNRSLGKKRYKIAMEMETQANAELSCSTLVTGYQLEQRKRSVKPGIEG
jgi:hypothetical protein